MKTIYLKALVILGIISLLPGCYTQVASGYDDYYGERKQSYNSESSSSEYEESSAVSSDTDRSDENYAPRESSSDESYCFGGGYFPHYRHYFWHYHPSYTFSVCYGDPYPPRWWDPWFGWYDPCFPTVVYDPWWYWHNPTPWYWIHPVTTVYYADNSYVYRTRERTRGREYGERGGVSGRDLTRLTAVRTRERGEAALDRFRDSRAVASSRNPFVLRERSGAVERSGIDRTRTASGGAIRNDRGLRSADASRASRGSADINSRLRDREKSSRGDVFKQDRNRTRLRDLDPAFGQSGKDRKPAAQSERLRGTEKRKIDPGDRQSGSRPEVKQSDRKTERKSGGESRDKRRDDSRSYSPGRQSAPSYTPSRRQDPPSYSPAPRSSGGSYSAPRSSGGGSSAPSTRDRRR